MPKFDVECTYCGHTWVDEFYYNPQDLRCKICNDKELKLRSHEKNRVDIYADQPETAFKKDPYVK